MSAIKIHSEKVILAEGNADEFVPDARVAAGMHGFVIAVPPGEGGERLLDMLWRIAMIYAGMPSLLRSRATMRKMVEAVMGKESRESKPARSRARKSGQRGQVADVEVDAVPRARLRNNITKAESPSMRKGKDKAPATGRD